MIRISNISFFRSCWENGKLDWPKSARTNKTHLKFGCLQFLLKRNNTKVQEKNSITFIVGLVLILWNRLLFVQSIE